MKTQKFEVQLDSVPTAQREQFLISNGVNGAFDYANLRNGVVGVSNKANLKGDAVSVDEFLGRVGAVSNASSNPTALPVAMNQYAVAYRDKKSNVRDTLNAIAPLVPAGQSFKYNKYSAIAEFLDITDGSHIRSIGQRKFKEVTQSKTVVDGSVDEKGLTIFIDRRQGGMNQAVQQRNVESLMNRLLRTELQEAITLLDANDTAPSSINWGTSNTSANPDKDLVGLISTAGDALGFNPNVLVMGGAFSLYRKQSILDAQRAGSTQAAYMTNEELASFLEIDRVVPLTTRRQTDANTKAKSGGANGFTLWIDDAPTLEDPSTLKRAYDAEFGADFTVWIETLSTGVLITVWHASKLFCPSSLGLYKQAVTYT